MGMKKKKTEKSENLQSVKSPARKTPGQVKESSHPDRNGIVTSVGALLSRTRAYFLSIGKAEA